MTPQEAWTVKIIFGSMGALCALAAAAFSCWEKFRNDEHEPIREWFRVQWEKAAASVWLHVPEGVIGRVVTCQQELTKTIFGIVANWAYFRVVICALSPLVLVGGWTQWTFAVGVIAFAFSVSPVIYVLAHNSGMPHSTFGLLLVVPCIVACFCFSGVTWTLICLGLSAQLSALIMFLLLPIYWYLLLGPVAPIIVLLLPASGNLRNTVRRTVFLLAMAAALSFSVTYAAFALGNLANPSSPLPQTLQMLLSNVLFDALTVVLTFALLRWSLARSPLARIPVAVALDIIAAACFALASLYIGLAFTADQLSAGEILNVLLARSSNGQRWELGPYFWVMHTTFIPTALYLALIMTCWFAKVLLSAASWFFGKGHENKNPLKLTAAVFAFFAALFFVLAYGAGAIEEHLKESAKTAPNESVQATP